MVAKAVALLTQNLEKILLTLSPTFLENLLTLQI